MSLLYIELINRAVQSNCWSCRSRENSVLRSNNVNNESDGRFTRWWVVMWTHQPWQWVMRVMSSTSSDEGTLLVGPRASWSATPLASALCTVHCALSQCRVHFQFSTTGSANRVECLHLECNRFWAMCDQRCDTEENTGWDTGQPQSNHTYNRG